LLPDQQVEGHERDGRGAGELSDLKSLLETGTSLYG
jgi:hypothetical protein